MPQDITAGIQALAGESGGASLSPQDYAGMNPKQMLGVAQQREQERANTATMLQNINQQKLQEAKAKIDAALNVKKQQIQEQKAKVLNDYRREQTDLLKSKLNRLEMKDQLTQRLSELQVETNLGPMSALQAKTLSEAGLPVMDEGAGEYSLELTDFDGNKYALAFNPSTGELSKTKLGPVTEDEGDVPKYESLAGKMDEAEQTLLRFHGASEFSGLEPEAREKFGAASTLYQSMLRENEKLEGKEAGTRAGQMVEQFDNKLSEAVAQGGKDEIVSSLTPAVKQARKLYKTTRSNYFHPSKVVDRLVDAGWSEQEARDIVKRAKNKAFSKE